MPVTCSDRATWADWSNTWLLIIVMSKGVVFPSGRAQKCACKCRFDLALHGWCSEECEDLLQHLMTVHLGSRDAADDSSFQDMLPAMQSAADNSHLSAAAFMHQKFAGLFKQYSLARQLQSGGTSWFSVAMAET